MSLHTFGVQVALEPNRPSFCGLRTAPELRALGSSGHEARIGFLGVSRLESSGFVVHRSVDNS